MPDSLSYKSDLFDSNASISASQCSSLIIYDGSGPYFLLIRT